MEMTIKSIHWYRYQWKAMARASEAGEGGKWHSPSQREREGLCVVADPSRGKKKLPLGKGSETQWRIVKAAARCCVSPSHGAPQAGSHAELHLSCCGIVLEVAMCSEYCSLQSPKRTAVAQGTQPKEKSISVLLTAHRWQSLNYPNPIIGPKAVVCTSGKKVIDWAETCTQRQFTKTNYISKRQKWVRQKVQTFLNITHTW